MDFVNTLTPPPSGSRRLSKPRAIWYDGRMQNRVLVAPSLLSADFGHLARGVRMIEEIGGDMVHLDVMDGGFVPNITFGSKAVEDLRGASRLPFDVHLMVDRPENHVEAFCRAGADSLTFHLEATTHVQRLLTAIRGLGKRPGIAIVPSTPAEALSEVLELVDMVLVMTVNPGFGGQKIIPRCLRKVETLRRMREREGYSFLIEVDGGINRDTIASALDAGAEVIVAGNAVFTSPDPRAEVTALRGGLPA
jgi:ribulose-phosphate 3-epimerase